MKTEDQKREYMREYMRKRRETQRSKAAVKRCKVQLVDVTHAEAEAEVKAEAVPPPSPAALPPVNGKIREGKSEDRVPTTPQALRFAALMHRKPSTPWQDNEIAAYKKIGIVPDDDMTALERYYAAHWPPKREANILRHDLLTLLNNLAGEIGRAHAEKQKPKAGRPMEWNPANVVPMPDPDETERIRIVTLEQIAERRKAER